MLTPLYHGDDLDCLYIPNPRDDPYFNQELEKLRNDFWEEKITVISNENISEKNFINSVGDSHGLRDTTSISIYSHKHGA